MPNNKAQIKLQGKSINPPYLELNDKILYVKTCGI